MTERLWMLLTIVMVVAIGILTGVVFQERNKVQSLEEERNACSDQREKLSFEARELNQQVTQLKEKQRDTERESRRSSTKLVAFEKSLEELEDERTVWEDEREKYKIREKHLKQQLDDFRSQLKASELATNEERNKVQSLEEERSVCSDQREKLSFEASELNQQVTQLKEKQRDTERESRRASAKLVALEESLEELEDERTEWEDEREKYKIREKHSKQQLDDLRSQLKASELATNEEKSRRLKSESDVEALNKEVINSNVQAITQSVLLAAALSIAFGKEYAPKTGNANPRAHPMLIKEFKTQAALKDNKSIKGIAKLNEDIFAITSGSNIIDRFDSASLSRTLTLTLQVYESLEDLQPCNRSQSLFVIEKESTGKRFIVNVDPYNKRIINFWEVDSCIIRISVTEDCHVLATCFEENKIIEYSSTGHLIQEIVLKPETGIVHPLFALKMVNGNFLVSYSRKKAVSFVSIAIVNSAGDVLKSYSDPLKREEMVIAMAIDGQGNVLIAEVISGRVLLLSPDLEYERDIVTKEHGTRMIHAVLLDEVNGRLFVADSSFNDEDQQFESGRVLVFDMK